MELIDISSKYLKTPFTRITPTFEVAGCWDARGSRSARMPHSSSPNSYLLGLVTARGSILEDFSEGTVAYVRISGTGDIRNARGGEDAWLGATDAVAGCLHLPEAGAL